MGFTQLYSFNRRDIRIDLAPKDHYISDWCAEIDAFKARCKESEYGHYVCDICERLVHRGSIKTHLQYLHGVRKSPESNHK